MKRFLSVGVVALVVGVGIWGYLYAQSRGSGPKYRLTRVERGPITAAVSATGNLNAVITVQVGSQVSGQIAQLMVDFNSPVTKNQVIARIDPEVFEAKVSQARADVDGSVASVLNQQAQVAKAKADLENARAAFVSARATTVKSRVVELDARRDLDRKSELLDRQLIAQADRDTSQANHDSAQAQLDAAKATEQSLDAAVASAAAQLDVQEAMLTAARAQVKLKEATLKQAELDLEHTTIRAPVDGVVVSRAVDVGQTVAASLQAPVLFTIAQDLTKMQVETSVDEADIGRLKEGDRATFTVDAFPGTSFSGAVTQIRKAGQIVQNVVTYIVIVTVPNPDRKLLPGMTANVKLVTAEKPEVLKVANAALRFRPTGSDTGPSSGPGRAGAAAGGAERGGAGGGPGGGPGGSPGGGRENFANNRERLIRELKLTPDQIAKLDPVLEDSRAQYRGLAGVEGAERQAQAAKIRETTRQRIRAFLTPEQQALYDQSTAARGAGGRDGTPGRVWIVGPDGALKQVNVTLGLSDGAATEIVRGDVKEGQDVVVGLAGAATPGGRPGGGGSQSGPRLRL